MQLLFWVERRDRKARVGRRLSPTLQAVGPLTADLHKVEERLKSMGGSIQKAFHTVGRKMDEMAHKIHRIGQGPSPPTIPPGRGEDNWRQVAPPTQPGKESKEPVPVRAMPSGKGGMVCQECPLIETLISQLDPCQFNPCQFNSAYPILPTLRLWHKPTPH